MGIDTSKICYGCFGEHDGNGPCPKCGFDISSAKHPAIALPIGTILNGRYLTGRVLGVGGFGVTYLALDMTLETRHCDGDSIVLRFVDKDPVGGLSKLLKGLPFYYYRVDTVMVSYSSQGPNGEHIEVNPHQEVDTIFAHVTAPCEYGKWCNNRLLSATSSSSSTGVSEYTDTTGNTVSRFFTGWEFYGDTISSHARAWYDTVDYSTPRMEGDRFILEVVLKK